MKKILGILLAVVSIGQSTTYADDIDIYVNATAVGSEPYVMLTLDWRPSIFNVLCTYGAGNSCETAMSAETYANLDSSHSSGDKISTFEAFVAVLETILSNPSYDPIYMGLMISNKDDGGTILEGYKLLGTDRAEIIDTLKLIPEIKKTADAHKLQPSETYYEWYRYINSGGVINGTEIDNNFGGSKTNLVPPTYDTSIMNPAETTYISPFTDPSACPKLYSILVAMNAANQDDGLDNEIKADMSKSAAFKFEDMMTYMHDAENDLLSGVDGVQPLQKSWVISDGGSIGATRDWASAGGSGSPLDLSDPKQLEEDLGDAFDEVISVSSTFVAASIPVNVFNRTDTLDNVYIALFEAQSTLRWPGNLKKLKLTDSDADGIFDSVIDASSVPKPGFESTGDDVGRITFDALTFWTDASALPVVSGLPNDADGREVARGGAGQKISGFIEGIGNVIGNTNATTNARQVFVEPATVTNGSSNTLDDFDADNTTADALDVLLGLTDGDQAGALELIKWGRGQDVDDEDGDTSTSDPRSWIMADAIHSRPLAINYGDNDGAGGYSQTNPNIRIFMGTNDGIFHVFENTSSAGAESGKEVFAFYPRESLGNIALQRTNTISSTKMRYGVDGTAVALTIDNDQDGNIETADGDKVYVYVGMRRGGNSYYAFDMSNSSATPTLLWKITNTSGGVFDELGLTFSTPIVGKVKYGSTATNVLIFTGGYNGGWNSAYTSRVGKDAGDTDDSVGNAVYIVNAETGELIWKAYGGGAVAGSTSYSSDTGLAYHDPDMVDSIPSSVSALATKDGIIHRLYVGDTGGAIWRVDLPQVGFTDASSAGTSSSVENNWFVTKFAELGTDGTTTDRRFFHEPDLLETKSADNVPFDGVLISSGNRADPQETDVTNYLFYLKDWTTTSGNTSVKSRSPIVLTDIPDQTPCATGSEGSCNSDLTVGWRVELEDVGEKGLATPFTDFGAVFFSTFVPATASACGLKEGDGYVYAMNLIDGSSLYGDQRKHWVGPGIPPGAIAGGNNTIFMPGGGFSPGDLDGDGIDDGRQKLLKSLGKNLWIMYWREPGIDNL